MIKDTNDVIVFRLESTVQLSSSSPCETFIRRPGMFVKAFLSQSFQWNSRTRSSSLPPIELSLPSFVCPAWEHISDILFSLFPIYRLAFNTAQSLVSDWEAFSMEQTRSSATFKTLNTVSVTKLAVDNYVLHSFQFCDKTDPGKTF